MKIIGCIIQEHDLRLVLLGGLICSVACFTTFSMLSRVAMASRAVRLGWLSGAAFVFGAGVFSTHFVAELAFQPHLPVAYEVYTTLLSLVIAFVGSAGAILIYMSRASRAWRVVGGGLLLGASVGAMHFTGMAAMRVPGRIVFDPGYVAASLVTGGLLSAVAFAAARDLQRVANRLVGTLCLVLAIVGLHFIAMAAVTIIPGPQLATHEVLWGSGPLAIVVATVSIAILLLSLCGSILDQHLAGRAARETQRLRQLADSSLEGIFIHRGGIVLDANQAMCRIAGRSLDDLIGRHVLECVAPGSADLVRQRLQTPERLQASNADLVEIELIRADGATLAVEILARPIEHDGGEAVVVAVRDLSDRKRAEAKIRHLAHHDGLTGLPNRFLFNDRLAQALELAGRGETAVAILCIDLDRFKYVNDLLGHDGGDRLLVLVAERLRATVRGVDTVARLGGDEFAIVQPLAENARAAASLSQRIIENLTEPFQIDGHELEIGASIGIANYPTDGQAGALLLKNADTALYRAKQDGGSRFCFFEAGMDLKLRERRSLEQDLRHAIDRGEMELHYQPLFDCASTEIEGFEALLRWTHPVRGRVPPKDFIPLAEESGLILPIGNWVLKSACAEAASWRRPLRVAVNLSPAQFRQSDLASRVAEILARTGLPAHRLELEVTEGVLIEDTEHALETLGELKSQGIRISLDDFGTGYSSLSYLLRFPFDKLKIDRSFVEASGAEGNAGAIVGAIVALARSLRVSVTAEGVETEAQLEMLRATQCDEVQGFLLGHPVPAERLAGLMAPLEARMPAA